MDTVKVLTTENLDDNQQDVLETFKKFQKAMIEKNQKTLEEIIDDNYTLTHLSGKTQTKVEYIDEIMDGTLNYYKSTIIQPQITLTDKIHAEIIADVELEAKVYGISGTWTLNTNVTLEKREDKWKLNQWKN